MASSRSWALWAAQLTFVVASPGSSVGSPFQCVSENGKPFGVDAGHGEQHADLRLEQFESFGVRALVDGLGCTGSGGQVHRGLFGTDLGAVTVGDVRTGAVGELAVHTLGDWLVACFFRGRDAVGLDGSR